MAFKLASVKDIPLGKSIIVHLENGDEVALFNVDGEIYALDNSCPHMGGPLGKGEVEDSIVTCPWHCWQFEIPSGCCLNMPGENARKIDIEIVGDDIYLKEQPDE